MNLRSSLGFASPTTESGDLVDPNLRAATSAMQTEEARSAALMGESPASAGSGGQFSEPAPLSTGQDDPYNLKPSARAGNSFLPKSPLERLGVRLLNMTRAVRGQELYSTELMRMQREQEAMDLDRLRIGIDAVAEGTRAVRGAPIEQQEAIAKHFGEMFAPVLGDDISATLLAARDDPKRIERMVETYGDLGETAIRDAGNLSGAEKLLENPQWVKMQREINVERQAPYVMHAFDRIEEMAAKDQHFAMDWEDAKKDGITFDELRKVAPVIGLTDRMLSAIRHSPELQKELRPRGFVPQEDADLAAEESIKAQHRAITPKTTEITEGGRKFMVALDPESGKELWRVNAGEATEGARGGKTTSSDIRAAINLRLRGADVAKSGIAPGAIAATDGMNEEQLMALDASLQGGGMSIEQGPDGTMRVLTGSMAAQREARKAKTDEEERKATTGVMKLVNLADRVREMAVANPDSTNFGGDVARFIDNLAADVVGTARTLGYDVTKNLNLPDDDPDKLTTLDPSRAPDSLFGALANKSAALKTAVFQLAIADAAANGQEGRGLSDKDLAASLRKVGGDVSSLGQLTSKIDEIERQHYDNLRLDYQTKHYDPETGKAAPFMSLEDLRKRARGEDVTPPAAGGKPKGAKDGGGEPPTPQSEAEYNALPSGTTYRDPDDGKLYRKP